MGAKGFEGECGWPLMMGGGYQFYNSHVHSAGWHSVLVAIALSETDRVYPDRIYPKVLLLRSRSGSKAR